MSLTVRRRVLVAVALVGAVGLVPLTAAIAARPDDGTGRIVLVSGRDDHGLLATARVRLLAAPGTTEPVGTARDGTLVEVVGTRGEWLEVRTVEGRPARGWVNDYYLRGVVHLVGPPPSCRVPLGGDDIPVGQQATVEAVRAGRVLVRTQHGGGRDWVLRRYVQELPPGGDCRAPTAPRSVPAP